VNHCRGVVTYTIDVENGIRTSIPRAKGWKRPAYCPTGVRHEGGVTLGRASIRNTGTCRSDVKGEIQAAVAARIRVPMRSTGAEMPVVGKKVL
jgi:hypothetical protein